MRDQAKGFTLIELLVTISVVAILATLALPSFLSTIQRVRADSETSDFQRLLNYARLEAINRGVSTRVMPVTGSAWTGQLKAVLISDVATVLRSSSALSSGATLVVPNNVTAIDFNNMGTLRAPGSSQVFTYTQGSVTNTVTVCLSGRVVLNGSCT